MGSQQHKQLRKIDPFAVLRIIPALPVAQDRLDAFNRYIEQKTRELLEIPVIDEHELEKAMEMKLQTVCSETEVPLLIDSIRPLANDFKCLVDARAS